MGQLYIVLITGFPGSHQHALDIIGYILKRTTLGINHIQSNTVRKQSNVSNFDYRVSILDIVYTRKVDHGIIQLIFYL